MYEISKLMLEFDKNTVTKFNKLEFLGVDAYDVYNITAPFKSNGQNIIAGRVEKRDSEQSKIMFFKQTSDYIYSLLTDYRVFDLQDPYISVIDGKLILGGTKIFEHPEIEGVLWYNANKFIGNEINDLDKFFDGPNGMKDIRLVQLKDNKILCFTRPQGEKGGRGQIGYIILDKIEDLTIEKINNAPMLELFIKEQWGGVNEAYLLEDGTIGVLGHIARFDEQGNRHYHAITFEFDTKTQIVENFKIVLLREQLLPGDSKRGDLIDVIFSGGLKFSENKTEIYVGVSDCESHVAEIKYPFTKGINN